MNSIRIGIVGDFNPSMLSHVATNDSIRHAAGKLGLDLQSDWLDTDKLEGAFEAEVRSYDGYWIAPGSPYKSMESVLRIIRFGRENHRPVLGTCGGFQHMVIEFARNVLGIEDAQHAEYDPYASKLVVNPLSCSLEGRELEIDIVAEDSLCFRILKTRRIRHRYYCNFGLNPDYQQALDEAGLRIVAAIFIGKQELWSWKDILFLLGPCLFPRMHRAKLSPIH